MLQPVRLPRLGQTVETATIDGWRVQVGDAVTKGDILLEITTDKATLEVESFVEGTVLKVYAEQGSDVPVGQVIAYVGDPDADEAPDAPPQTVKTAEAKTAPASGTAAPAAPASADERQDTESTPGRGRLVISPRARKRAETEKVSPLAVTGSGPGGRITERDILDYAGRVAERKVSPTARSLARIRGVDLLAVEGSGPGGRILKQDVEAAAPLKAPAAAGRRIELSPARRVIARRMAQSKREAPHYYLQMDIDMTECVALRERLKADGTKVSYNDFIIRAVARGLRAVPSMNAGWSDDGIVLFDTIDVSLAVALEDRLMVPVVRGAGNLTLAEVAAETGKLIDKARNKRLTPADYEGGGITVSNLGMFDVDNFLPIINPGQASILGVGRIADRAVVVDGELVVRKMMSVTLSTDHRIADGATAAAFLQTVKAELESPTTASP